MTGARKRCRRRVPASQIKTPSLRVLMRRLRKRAPTKAPVRLVQQRGVRSGGEWVLGYAAYRRTWSRRGRPGRIKSHRIVVDSRLPLVEKWEVVVHEWAHCLDRMTRPRQPNDCHDARWGQCYSRAFRASLAPDLMRLALDST